MTRNVSVDNDMATNRNMQTVDHKVIHKFQFQCQVKNSNLWCLFLQLLYKVTAECGVLEQVIAAHRALVITTSDPQSASGCALDDCALTHRAVVHDISWIDVLDQVVCALLKVKSDDTTSTRVRTLLS